MMEPFTKKVYEKFPISFEFAGSLGDSETITSVSVSAVNSSGTNVTNNVIDSSSIVDTAINVAVKSGTAGEKYTIICKITTSTGNYIEENALMWVYAYIDMIAKIKIAVRIANTAYDEEIMDLVLAAKADLGISGIVSEKIIETDALITRAILTYCKANFGWNNPDSYKLQMAYESLRNHLSMSTDYAFFAVTFTVTDSLDSAIREANVTFDGETKYTDSNGQAIFYVRAGANYTYVISADGYASDDDEDNLLDVTASTSVDITLGEV